MKINIPTREECYALLKEYDVPENIVRHSEVVNKVAVFLAKELIKKGIDINLELVDKASLLHDLDKMHTIKSPKHGLVSQEILNEKEYPEIGEIAMLHRFKMIHKPMNWEAKIVSYSDKRVKHDKIVSMRERFDDLTERYGVLDREKQPETERLYFKLEKEIFEIIGTKPESLVENLSKQ